MPQVLQAPARLLQPLAGVLNAAGVKQHEVPQVPAHMAAGQGVVADEGDSVGRQAFPAHPQQGVADLGRHPGVNAMQDDVVELAPIPGDVPKVGRA